MMLSTLSFLHFGTSLCVKRKSLSRKVLFLQNWISNMPIGKCQFSKIPGNFLEREVYCDKALPFGLRSAPIIFNAVADGLSWAMICSGIMNLVHCPITWRAVSNV